MDRLSDQILRCMAGACDDTCKYYRDNVCENNELLKEVEEKLKLWQHYEDMEEQGRLIVVRCKVCEYYDTQDCGEGAGWCRAVNAGRFDDWYCDSAKLKELEGDKE